MDNYFKEVVLSNLPGSSFIHGWSTYKPPKHNPPSEIRDHCNSRPYFWETNGKYALNQALFAVALSSILPGSPPQEIVPKHCQHSHLAPAHGENRVNFDEDVLRGKSKYRTCKTTEPLKKQTISKHYWQSFIS